VPSCSTIQHPMAPLSSKQPSGPGVSKGCSDSRRTLVGSRINEVDEVLSADLANAH
jgi:hypothetical protein